MIEFNCTKCSQHIKVNEAAAGKSGKCPKCKTKLLVPSPEVVTLEPADKKASVPKQHRKWMIALIVIAIMATPLIPTLALVLGICFLILCGLAFVPPARGISSKLLKLDASQKFGSIARVGIYGVLGVLLIIASSVGSDIKAKHDQQEALAAKANSKVAAIVSEAETAWQDSDAELANQKLAEATKIPNATDFRGAKKLRAKMANAQVASLVSAAKNDLAAGNIEAAKQKVQAANVITSADELDAAKKLKQQIELATDGDKIQAVLMDISDEDFGKLQNDGTLPSQLVTGYSKLDAHASKLAKAEIPAVAAAREKRKAEEEEKKNRPKVAQYYVRIAFVNDAESKPLGKNCRVWIRGYGDFYPTRQKDWKFGGTLIEKAGPFSTSEKQTLFFYSNYTNESDGPEIKIPFRFSNELNPNGSPRDEITITVKPDTIEFMGYPVKNAIGKISVESKRQ